MTATRPTPVVHVVDDDRDVARSIALVLDAAGIGVVQWAAPLEFLQKAGIGPRDCVLLDVRMPGRSGPEVQEELRGRGVKAPVIFLTAHGDVPTSVRAMKGGAEDFLLKPVDPARLLEVVRQALRRAEEAAQATADLSEIRRRHALLTPRERDVMGVLVLGASNKEGAATLGITENTMKVHRLRIMEKMQAGSLAELVRMGVALGIGADRPLA